MPKYLALFALLLAGLACAAPINSSPSNETAATPDLAAVVAATLTAVADLPTPAPSEAPETPAPAVLTVVYTSQENLALWREGSGAQTLATSIQPGSTPRISDDGQIIAFLRDGELYSIRADGSHELLLAGTDYFAPFLTGEISALRIHDFDFAPNSHDLFFSFFAETEFFPYPLDDLHTVNAESGSPQIMLPAGQGGAWNFAPNGQRFALVQGDQIRVLNRDGSENRPLFSFTFISTYSEWTYHPEVVWRDDSAGFYTLIPAAASLENPLEPSRYYYVPLDGSSPTQLAEFITVPVWESFPRLAPNGLSAAYAQGVFGSHSLRVIEANATERALNDQQGLVLLNWNPDSQSVVFAHASQPAEVYLQAPTGAPLALNDTGGALSDLRWISETRYLFISNDTLHLGEISAASLALGYPASGYDFTTAP